MANNLFANIPAVVVSKNSISFASAGINSTNTSIIFEVGNPLKSYIPGRSINPVISFTAGKGYYIVPKTNIDLSALLVPPSPTIPTGAGSYVMEFRSDHVTDFIRDGTRSMQLGNHLYSFGGWHVPEESFNDVYRSTGDLSIWEKMPDAPWHPRHVYGIAKRNGVCYIAGGDNLHSLFDIWASHNGTVWNLVSEPGLHYDIGDRIYYGFCNHKINGVDYFFIVGGLHSRDVWKSQDGITWTQIVTGLNWLGGPPMTDGNSNTGSLASFAGKLWMVSGGGDGFGSGPMRSTVYTSLDGITWTLEATPFPGNPVMYTDVCVWDNKLWAVGGYSEQVGNEPQIFYMDAAGTWYEFTGQVGTYIGSHATGVAVYTDYMTGEDMLAITCGNYQNVCHVIRRQ